MRRWIALALAAVMILCLAACTSPFRQEIPSQEESSSAAEPSFVITTFSHSGLEKMLDAVKWYDNAVCAIEYLGTRADYTKQLRDLCGRVFSQIDAETLQKIKILDGGGNDVFLLVPRFDLEEFSVFSIVLDERGHARVLRQVGETNHAFILICDAGSAPNAQVNVTLSSLKQTFKAVVQKKEDGELSLGNGFQPIEVRS